MNKEAIDLLIRQQPRLRSQRSRLEALQEGTFVVHRSWGLGKIADYDEKENKLIIDFESDRQGHGMDPAFCVNRLEILPDDHIVVRHRRDPAEIDEMIKSQQCDLIAEILKSQPEHTASAAEIERQIHRLMGPTKGKKWWTATKKLLVKDARIGVPAKKSEPYVLREKPIKAEEEVLEEFFRTKAPKKKIGLASKLLDLSVSHDDIKEALPDVLKDLTEAIQHASKSLTEGERLHGVWVRNDLARFIHADPEQLDPSSASIMLASNNLPALAAEVPATHYRRFIEVLVRNYPDEWLDHVFDLLKASSGKMTNECISFLMEHEKSDELKETFVRWLDEQTMKGPILQWIIKNRNSRKFSKLLNDLVNPRFLSAILQAIDSEFLHTAGNRRIPLSEELDSDKELIADLLAEADLENARDLAKGLMLNPGFEELTKRSILARFIRIFPSVQSVISGEEETDAKVAGLFVSEESYEQRKKEYDILVSSKIPENKQAIAVAREHGDLRENAEYKMARQDQEALLARKGQLEQELSRAQITDFSEAKPDRVGIGSVVELTQESTGNRITYNLLGAWDSDPDKFILSYQTPLAQGIIGHGVGDTVEIEVAGNRESWTIRQIRRWVDETETPDLAEAARSG